MINVIAVVVVFDVIVFSIVPRQKYLIDYGFRTRANYFDFERDEKVDTIFEIWEILRIGDNCFNFGSVRRLTTLDFPWKEIEIMKIGKHCLILISRRNGLTETKCPRLTEKCPLIWSTFGLDLLEFFNSEKRN